MSGPAKKPKANDGTDVDMDSKDDSDIDAGSRAPKAKAKGKARAVQDDDDAGFEDEAPKRKAATSGPKDASDQYQKVLFTVKRCPGAPLTLSDGF